MRIDIDNGCFSTTGNSLALARAIANGLEDCELISIPKVLKGSVDFICGIISSLLYLVVDITASVYWNEFYNIIVFGLCTFMAAEKSCHYGLQGFCLLVMRLSAS